MVQWIIKRDGSYQSFQAIKVATAIQKAAEKVGDPSWRMATTIANKIAKLDQDTLTVEECQDLVEQALIRSSKPKVAQEYIRFRHQRNLQRKSTRYKVLSDITNCNVANDVIRENGNINGTTPSGQICKFASEGAKEYTLDVLLEDRFSEAHKEGWIHIHDLDWLFTRSVTCVQHPLDRVFKGFDSDYASARSPKRIETAAILACISLQFSQNMCHGGQAIPAFDFYMAPYVYLTFKEEIDKASQIIGIKPDYTAPAEYVVEEVSAPKMDENPYYRARKLAINNTVFRVHQAMESFIHNMSTMHSRGGSQVVFSSINYGTDTSAEGRCVIRELLNVTYVGVGNGKTAIFPIQIWKCKTGVSLVPGDTNYDLFQLACKVSAKRYFPNFLNLDVDFNQSPNWSLEDPERYKFETAVMGCRSRLWGDRFGDSTSIGRGNLSFTTINLPRLAIESNHDIDKFFNLLTDYANLVAEQLYSRYKWQCTALKKQFPFLMQYLWMGTEDADPNSTVEDVLRHGTLGVGFIGLAETLVALIGQHHGESTEAQELGLRIVKYLSDLCDSFSDKYNLNYSCFATPAEGLAGRFVRMDREKYGEIPGVTDREFYTNSSHVPVYHHICISDKIAIEAPYHRYELGGHIGYVELDGDPSDNIEAFEECVQKAMQSGMGYFSVNFNSNTCMSCGHQWVGRESKCPVCGSEDVDTLQRVTGYLIGSTSRWNNGKLAEFRARVTHN